MRASIGPRSLDAAVRRPPSEERCLINYSIQPDTHAGACRQVPTVQLVAAADPNEPKRKFMQERWGVPVVYADYREMVEKERPDLISVTTRAPLHAEVTIAAAGAGAKGVLCEKAMTTSRREADAMIEACLRAGTVLMINHTRRWHPTWEQALKAVRDGAIGTLRAIVGICPGPLIHNGTHLFDLMRMFSGDAAWVAGQVQDGPCEDRPGRALLKFDNGVAGFVDLDSKLGFAIELQGTGGRLFIDPAEVGFTIWEYQHPLRSQGDRQWYQGNPCRQRTVRHLSSDTGSGAAKGTLVAAIEELIACIEEGRENRSSGQDGRAALELALAVCQSHARGGAQVTLPLQDRELAVNSR